MSTQPSPPSPPPQARKTVSESTVRHTHVIKPEQVDETGVAYGGEILALVDVVGVVCAQRHSDMWGSCVTASVDAVHFLTKIQTGDMVSLTACCNRSWRTSMEIEVLVEAENIRSGTVRYASHAFLTFVALDRDPATGRQFPVPVPELVPQTPQEKQRWVEADKRKTRRIAMAKANSESAPPTSSSTPPVMTAAEAASSSLTPSVPLKPSLLSIVETTHVVFPTHVNHMGNAFGGQVLKWMEEAAHLSAYRHAREHVLTASLDAVSFSHPIRVGDVITVMAKPSCSFGSSLEVFMRVSVQRSAPTPDAMRATETLVTNDGYATLVATDSSGARVEVPRAVPTSQEAMQRWQGGEGRRKARLEGRRDLEAARAQARGRKGRKAGPMI